MSNKTNNNLKDWEEIPKVKTSLLNKQRDVSRRMYEVKREFVPTFIALSRISENVRRQLKEGLPPTPIQDVFNIVCDPAMLRIAFRRLSKNKGASTPGPDTADTADAMSEEFIQQISLELKSGKFIWSDIKRIYIPKPGKSKLRPLGLPNFSDKLVQDSIRQVLNAVYEPEFQKTNVIADLDPFVIATTLFATFIERHNLQILP